LSQREIYEFGAFRLDVAEHSLSARGRAVPLKPKVFETLLLLVRNAGHLLPKQELMSQLWPDAVVDETNLNRNVWLIRRALGDGDDSSEYIETVPRIGYRFVGEVRRIEGESAARPVEVPRKAMETSGAPETIASVAPAVPSRRTRAGVAGIAGAAAAAVAVVVAGALALRSHAGTAPTPAADSRPTISVLGFRNLSSRPDLDWICAENAVYSIVEGRRPNAVDLDGLTDRPVFVTTYDQHSVWLNRAALRALGVADGGELAWGRPERDPATGEPTGWVTDFYTSAMTVAGLAALQRDIPMYSPERRYRKLGSSMRMATVGSSIP